MAKRKMPGSAPPADAGASRKALCLGAHLSIAGGVSHALEQARAFRFQAVQIFVKNQRQWRAPPLDPAEVERWHALRPRHGARDIAAHATYLINLASAEPALAKQSRAAFLDELLRCDQLDIPYLVVHPGAAGDQPRTTALRVVAQALDAIFTAKPDLRTMPLLEFTAGQGSSLGNSFAELAEIIARVQEPQRVGVCLDTCHLFAAGHDLRDPTAYERMVQEAAATVGLERVRVWHFNDSRTPCGSRVDRHAHIGHGCIGNRGFRHVMDDERFRGIPMLIETPKGLDDAGRHWDVINVRRLRQIAARMRPAPNPSD